MYELQNQMLYQMVEVENLNTLICFKTPMGKQKMKVIDMKSHRSLELDHKISCLLLMGLLSGYMSRSFSDFLLSNKEMRGND